MVEPLNIVVRRSLISSKEKAVKIPTQFSEEPRNFTGESFWTRGCFVPPVGLDEEIVKNCKPPALPGSFNSSHLTLCQLRFFWKREDKIKIIST